MKLFLPKQHGAWAMLIIPFWLGVATTKPIWQHIPFFFGWILLYLSTYPMLLMFKKKKLKFYLKWTLNYLVLSLLFLLIPVVYEPKILYFGAIMLPFFVINAFYSSINKERSIGNDISAIIAFSLAGIGSGYFVNEQLTTNLMLVFLTCVLFFMGSTFYVKTMIREKKNDKYKWISWSYHLIVLLICLITGEWMITLAFLPSFLRAIGFYGQPLSAKMVGIYEIVNAALFFLLVLIRIVWFN